MREGFVTICIRLTLSVLHIVLPHTPVFFVRPSRDSRSHSDRSWMIHDFCDRPKWGEAWGKVRLTPPCLPRPNGIE